MAIQQMMLQLRTSRYGWRPAMGPADGAPDPLFGDAGPAGGDPATGPDMPPGDPMGEPGPMDSGPGGPW